jgi:cytochrome c oxidase assembly protein subunit 11
MAAAFAAGMLGLAYASVPLYRLFCQVTGFGGTTQRAVADDAPGAVATTMSVRFDANVAPGLGWKFVPVDTQTTVRIGERRLAFYQATNLTDQPITGVATFNVSPDTAGAYFVKIQCFCFNEQTLQPGETVDMPVSYYIDPALLDDASARKIDEITLSYTFFPVEEEVAKTESNGIRG